MSVMERFAGNGADFYSWHVGNGEGYRIRLCPESWRQKQIFAGLREWIRVDYDCVFKRKSGFGKRKPAGAGCK